MVARNKKADSTEGTKVKRTILTGAEKLAKMQADLVAEQQKQADKARTKLVAAREELSKAKDAQTKANAKVEAAEAKVTELEGLVGDEPATSSDEG